MCPRVDILRKVVEAIKKRIQKTIADYSTEEGVPFVENYTVGRGIHLAMALKFVTKISSRFRKLGSSTKTFFCTTDLLSQLNARLMKVEDEIICHTSVASK